MFKAETRVLAAIGTPFELQSTRRARKTTKSVWKTVFCSLQIWVHVHLSTLCDGLLSSESLRDLLAELAANEPPLLLRRVCSKRLELLVVEVVWSKVAFNDRLLLFLLSFRSFSLLTLSRVVELERAGDEEGLIALVSITWGRAGNVMLRILSSCLRSERENLIKICSRVENMLKFDRNSCKI